MLLLVWMWSEPAGVGAPVRGGRGALGGGAARSMAKLFLPGGDRFYCAGTGATRRGEGGPLAGRGRTLYAAAGHTARHALPDGSLGTDGGPTVLGACSPSVCVRSHLCSPPPPPPHRPERSVYCFISTCPPPSALPPPPPHRERAIVPHHPYRRPLLHGRHLHAGERGGRRGARRRAGHHGRDCQHGTCRVARLTDGRRRRRGRGVCHGL